MRPRFVRLPIAAAALVALTLPASADKYHGRVPEGEQKALREYEASMEKQRVAAQEECSGSKFKVEVDWKSFPKGKWTNTWNPSGAVGMCEQALNGIMLACGDGHTKRMREVKTVRCHYTNKLPLRFKSEDQYEPKLAIKDATLHAGYDERDDFTGFMTPMKHLLDSKYVRPAEPPKHTDAKYQGMVDKKYFRDDMMEDAERSVEKSIKNANERCGRTFTWSIDWKSYDGDWSNTWNPIGMVGYCGQAVSGMNLACYDGYKEGLERVSKIHCAYTDPKNLVARGSDRVPGYKIKGDTLYVTYADEDMTGFDVPMAHFLGKPESRSGKPGRGRRR